MGVCRCVGCSATALPEQVADAWLLLDRNLALFSRTLGLDLSKSPPGVFRGPSPFLIEVDGASSQLKLQARRPRSYLRHLELEPCLPPETGYFFPSGHATWYAAASAQIQQSADWRSSCDDSVLQAERQPIRSLPELVR